MVVQGWSPGAVPSTADMPDPFVLAVDAAKCADLQPNPPACYYAYSTQIYFAVPIPVYKSVDLTSWRPAGPPGSDGKPDGAAIAGGDIAPWAQLIGHWAPSVLHVPSNPPGQQWVLWYSAVSQPGVVGDGQAYHCLGVAVAASPDGPFRDANGRPAYCQWNLGGSIDPSPFRDSNGALYLHYQNQGVSNPYVSTRLWSAPLTPDGQHLSGEAQLLEVDRGAGSWEYPIIEGPSMMRSPAGVLFLFYSAYRWETADYRVGVATCDSPTGPCRRFYSTPVLASRGAMLGPGGQTPFQDVAGQWRLAFHAWTAGAVGYNVGGQRTMRILGLNFPSGNPQIG